MALLESGVFSTSWDCSSNNKVILWQMVLGTFIRTLPDEGVSGIDRWDAFKEDSYQQKGLALHRAELIDESTALEKADRLRVQTFLD
eukprot:4648117-Amphidinium_carterae.1